MFDTSSWKSSEASSSLGDERERAKILQKIIEVKDKLKVMNDEREAEVVKFLQITKTSEKNKGITENPQLIRIRNNFERRNKKHTNETEHLQRKLAEYEERLKLIDNGQYEVNVSKSAVITNGIKKASANVKGMTESVITAPLELAQLH
ncbi:unnamed protein product [Caenorhabditis angaria]|uniref:Uncharacterized protein n=1 Tax=Caenorhabditis angaria TaxID=860376 RepID=A0A9P1J3F7_9PELO|nr:unnamed protein product [Caenorhabditis angaria]